MGGLGAGHAAATLAFLPFADGLIFVSDASAELSAPEVDFLRRATELCPTVMFALTKIDLYPQWERIADLDRGHLDRNALRIPMVAVSSAVRAEALARKDRELNEHSRFPALVKELGDQVVAPAKAGAAARSANEGTIDRGDGALRTGSGEVSARRRRRRRRTPSTDWRRRSSASSSCAGRAPAGRRSSATAPPTSPTT